MPNSKYPQQLDTSVEIPPVRDNITEIGSDVINSLRSAIFKIESTLGINPQGSAGNSVSYRLSKSLDENGNILKEALDRSNVLSGPIIDSDVSSVASIKESKLKLDFPTKVLQSEISSLSSQIKNILEAVEAASLKLAIHLNPASLNSHSAKSISVAEAGVVPSDNATNSLEAGTLQETLEEIYNSHINYSGINISSLNNSHSAAQIYFDNTNIGSLISSNNLQGALESIISNEGTGLTNSVINTSSNGRIRRGKVYDAFENSPGSILYPVSSASFSIVDGSGEITFSITTPEEPLGEINKFDILNLSGSTFDSDNGDYQIKSFSLNGLGSLQTVTVFGGPKNLSASAEIKIIKNPYISYNPAGFCSVARPRYNKTNTPDVQVLNPDSATIISRGIKPGNITSTNHTFNISVDGNTPITIDTYNSVYSEQTIDTVVQKINDQAVDQHLNFTAFKVRGRNCYELAIAHNVPNIQSDIKNRTIKIESGSSNDGTANLGFTNSLNIEVEGTSGNSVNLNGKILTSFGLIKTFTEATIQIIQGTLTISLFGDNLSSYGVRIGDLVFIEGSTNSSDDGTYRIAGVSGSIADLDLFGNNFGGTLGPGSIVHIIRSSAPVYEFEFEEISGVDGTIVFDVFLSGDRDILQSKRLELAGNINSGPFRAVISDVSRGFIIKDEIATLSIDTSGYATLTDPSLQTSDPVYIAASGEYKLFSVDNLSFITIIVEASGPPTTNISTNIYGFDELSYNNYHICRGSFATGIGRILGDSSPTDNGPGIPALVDKRSSGTADHSIIGESFIEKYIEGARGELRGSGVVRGCQVLNTSFISGAETYQTFSISSGVLYVNGIRFEFPGIENVRINTANTYIIAINNQGCIIADNYITDPADPTKTISPFFERNVAYLGEVSNNGTSTSIVDLRLFIDNLDLKLIGDIKVSNDSRNGHFTDLKKAVAYSKLFRKMFPSIDSPTILIENGTYIISETIILDFDIRIKGSGPSTILKKSESLHKGVTYSSGKVDMLTSIFLIGLSQNTSSNLINYGITIEDITFESLNGYTDVGCMIALTQTVGSAPNATYRFENLNFIGPTDIDATPADSLKVADYAMIIGRQNPTTLVSTPLSKHSNIMIRACRFVRSGLEAGGVKLLPSAGNEFTNIIASNNIMSEMSPNLNNATFILIEYPGTGIVTNVIEVGNVRLN